MMRQSQGMSISALAARLGVTYQQVRKYEKGQSALSCLRLHEASQVLGVPYEAFFDNTAPQSSLQVPAINPAIMTRALKLQHVEDRARRAKILKIIDILTA